jgi:hypothetical protein
MSETINLPAHKTPWNPSRRAIKRVLNPLPAPTACPYCSAPVAIKNNDLIYGKSYGDWPWLFLCKNDECRAYVGMHPFTNIPLGTMADAKTREARKLTKELFIKRWGCPGQMDRSGAYEWLAVKLNIPLAACHFGWFDIEMCRKAYRVLKSSIT